MTGDAVAVVTSETRGGMTRPAIAIGIGRAGGRVMVKGFGSRSGTVDVAAFATAGGNRGLVTLAAGQGAFGSDLVMVQGKVGRRMATVAAGTGFLGACGQAGMAKAAAHVCRRTGQGMVFRHLGARRVAVLATAGGRLQPGVTGRADRFAIGVRIDIVVMPGLIEGRSFLMTGRAIVVQLGTGMAGRAVKLAGCRVSVGGQL